MLEDNVTPESESVETTVTPDAEAPAKTKTGRAKGTAKTTANLEMSIASRKALDDTLTNHKETGVYKGTIKDYLEFVFADYERLQKENEALKKQLEKVQPAASDTGNSEVEEKPQPWFTAISGTTKAERDTKLSEIKELLGIPESDGIFMTRSALYAKAAELSGKTVAEVIEAGADSEAQSIITSKRTGAKGANRGRAGAGDEKLDKAFVAIVKEIVDGSYSPVKGLLPLTAISMKVRTNPKTAENWAQRRGLVFKMDTETAIEEARKIEEELNQIAEHGR